jgi:hypothetical protein
MESSKCGKQDSESNGLFSKGGFQQNISSSHMVLPPPSPLPSFCVLPSLSLTPPPSAPLAETALWLRFACRGVPFTQWVAHPDHEAAPVVIRWIMIVGKKLPNINSIKVKCS